jgi:hypothetical protein
LAHLRVLCDKSLVHAESADQDPIADGFEGLQWNQDSSLFQQFEPNVLGAAEHKPVRQKES